MSTRCDKKQAPQILHVRNTSQKYVEIWEASKSSRKVLDMLIDKDLRLDISDCFWLLYASKYKIKKHRL